jgi:hypothetical protein
MFLYFFFLHSFTLANDNCSISYYNTFKEKDFTDNKIFKYVIFEKSLQEYKKLCDKNKSWDNNQTEFVNILMDNGFAYITGIKKK